MFINLALQNPDEIVSSIPSIPSKSNAVPLVLVTPSLAHWLDPTSPFLSDFMGKLHNGSSETPAQVHAVAAVIDKIPANAVEGAATEADEYDGLSVLIVDNDNVQWKAAPPRRFGSPDSEEPSLFVSVGGESSAQTVGLRLANTVFTNGKERTFFAMRWASSDNGFVLDKSVGLTNCLVTSPTTNVQPTLSLPLHPVTKRRRVVTGMGNILRQLAKSTDGSSEETITASTELEQELPRYIQEHNITDKRVSVWALVEKPEVEVADQNSSTQDRLAKSLGQGGKLHRVMSGGGGWGKKQGLLSLDPEVAFPNLISRAQSGLNQIFDSDPATQEIPLEMPMFLENGLIGEDLSHLSQVANPGDFIQFFVSVEPTAQKINESGSKQKYCFGVVSDAESNVPLADGEEQQLKLVNNMFGALSEKAITYSQPILQGSKAAESTTKLDIPGSRVVLELS